MNDLEKVQVMLPHWIEHNQGHGAEFLQWAEKLEIDFPEMTTLLRNAAVSLQEAEQCLQEALIQAGGPVEQDHCHVAGEHHHLR
ncbi:MAG: hypothetical protein D3923_10530 [Candidatus Electrothrix sp. AR3]|nr:hypothetical protein [Candidatus Electrothrix sp. AR3]